MLRQLLLGLVLSLSAAVPAQSPASKYEKADAESANYWEWIEQGSSKPEGGGCPVLVVSGSKDAAGPPRIFPQSDQAVKRLQDLGFTRVERRHLQGRDHEPFYELGLELFDKVQAETRKK